MPRYKTLPRSFNSQNRGIYERVLKEEKSKRVIFRNEARLERIEWLLIK